jgi:hypothetical protein
MTETAITIEESIKLEIARFDPFEARLLELKEQYSGLTINGIEDKEGYENVRLAIAELRGIRTGTTKDKAIIKKPFLQACETIETKSKWIIAEVSKIEDPLQKLKDDIDAEKEKIKQAKQTAQQATFIKRSIHLSNMGAIFDGTNFILDDVSYEGVLVKEADEDVYLEFILPKFQKVFDQREIIRLAEEKVKQEAAEKEKQEREAFAAAQAELKRAQDELIAQQQSAERERAEIVRKEQERLDAERKEKERQQTALQSKRLNELLPYNKYGESVDMATLWTWSDTDFNKILGNKKEEYEVAQAKIAEENRIERERQIKLAEEAAAERERLRIEHEQKQAILKAQQEAERKAEELAKAGEKANWEAVVAQIAAIKIPAFRSSQYRSIAKQAQAAIDGILNLKA